MLRNVFTVVCLLVVPTLMMAEERTYGKFKSFKDGTLTLTTVKKGEEGKDVTYKIADDTKASLVTGGEKKEVGVKEAFKDLQEGTIVIVTLDGEKVTGLQIAVKKN